MTQPRREGSGNFKGERLVTNVIKLADRRPPITPIDLAASDAMDRIIAEFGTKLAAEQATIELTVLEFNRLGRLIAERLGEGVLQAECYALIEEIRIQNWGRGK